MAIKAKVAERKPVVEAGMYTARCYGMIHLGEAFDENYNKKRDLVRISWELPTELKVFNEEKGEQPVVISKQYTLSLHEKSTLTQDLESWRGKGFTKEERTGFDLLNLLGATCMLNIIHSEDGHYANIKSVNPLPKGVKIPKLINPIQVFDFDENFTVDIEDNLPSFITDRIKESEQWHDKTDEMEYSEEETKKALAENDKKSDLPFIITILLSVGTIVSMLI